MSLGGRALLSRGQAFCNIFGGEQLDSDWWAHSATNLQVSTRRGDGLVEMDEWTFLKIVSISVTKVSKHMSELEGVSQCSWMDFRSQVTRGPYSGLVDPAPTQENAQAKIGAYQQWSQKIFNRAIERKGVRTSADPRCHSQCERKKSPAQQWAVGRSQPPY